MSLNFSILRRRLIATRYRYWKKFGRSETSASGKDRTCAGDLGWLRHALGQDEFTSEGNPGILPSHRSRASNLVRNSLPMRGCLYGSEAIFVPSCSAGPTAPQWDGTVERCLRLIAFGTPASHGVSCRWTLPSHCSRLWDGTVAYLGNF